MTPHMLMTSCSIVMNAVQTSQKHTLLPSICNSHLRYSKRSPYLPLTLKEGTPYTIQRFSCLFGRKRGQQQDNWEICTTPMRGGVTAVRRGFTVEYCLRCRTEVATEKFWPCNHLVLCELCCQICADRLYPLNYLVCGLCGSDCYKVVGIKGTVYYTPGIGYCSPDYLKERVFIASSGIAWKYYNRLASTPFIEKLNNTVSVPARDLTDIDWADTGLEVRKEEFIVNTAREREFLNHTLQSRIRHQAPPRPRGNIRNSTSYYLPN